jgi:hypothetical protein
MKRPLLLGSALIGVMLPIHVIVAQSVSVQIAAVTLGIIAGAYIGFAAADGTGKALAVELFGAALFGTAAVVGLVFWPLGIPIAILLHAGWDWAHHSPGFGASVPRWYIPFCVVIDVFVGACLLVVYVR